MRVNRSKSAIFARVLLTALLSAGMTLAIVFRQPLAAVAAALLLVWNGVGMFRYFDFTARQMRRLVHGIRFGEFNVSFSGAAGRGGSDETLAGELARAVGMFDERMQRRETELNFYELLLNRIDFAIIAVNSRGEVVWINKSALDMVGNPRPRTLSDMDRLSEGLSSILEGMTVRDVKSVNMQIEGADYNCVAMLSSIATKSDTLRVFSLKELRPFIEETESKAWEKLIRILTHEIMNSITPIVSLSESFARRSREDEALNADEMRKVIEVIHRRSRGLIKFVNDYRQITHIAPPRKELFEVGDMLRDMSELLGSQGIVFEWEVVPWSLEVFADRTQLEQAVLNLVKNGWEACADNGDPRVRVEAGQDEYQRPVISISDNGCGILPEVMEKLFIPFFTTRSDGSGIGLSISRQIVTAHGGTLNVSSEVGRGSTFTIRL